MTTETLSSKIVYDEIDDTFQQIPVKDVREFIRKVKEDFENTFNKYGFLTKEEASNIVNNRAGKDLIDDSKELV